MIVYAIEGKMQTHGCCLIRLRRTSNKIQLLTFRTRPLFPPLVPLVRELLTEILIEHPHFIERFKVKMPFHAINYSDKLTTIIHKYDHIIKKTKQENSEVHHGDAKVHPRSS